MNVSKDKIKVITLSGVNTIGRNAYVIEKNNRLLVVDYGLGFPDVGVFGVQGILPDVNWLIKNKKRIEGIVVTHAHMDHVGGIPYVLDLLGYPPIYGSRFAIEFIKEKLKEFKKHKEASFHSVVSGDNVKIGREFSVHFAHVTHSIPQCFAVAVDTSYGKVVYTGDFKFDSTPINDRPTDTDVLEKWRDAGILAALLDSTNVYEQGHSKSETSIVGVLEEIIAGASGRVIIGMFSSLVSRLVGILEIAKRLDKKVAFTGRSLESNVKIAMRIGYLTLPRNLVIPIKDVDKYPDNQVIILSTGSQGEQMASLTRMARNKHAYVKLKKTDTIILSSSVIPTNVVPVQDLMDKLSRTGATVVNSKLMDVHVSGHAYQEELKQMALLLDAKYYIPVHGYTSFLFQHRLLLMEAGIDARRILIPSEGGIFKFSSVGVEAEKKIKTKPVIIYQGDLLPAGDGLIRDREIMASGGHIVVFITRLVPSNFQVILKGVVPLVKLDSVKQEIRGLISHVLSSEHNLASAKKRIYAVVGRWARKNLVSPPLISVENSKSFSKGGRKTKH